MDKRTTSLLLAGLALVAVAAALHFGLGARTTGAARLNLDPYTALGVVTAEETAKLLGEEGRVLVMVRDTGPNTNPSIEAQVKAFQQTLKPRRGVSVVVEKFQLTPMQMLAAAGGVPTDQLFRALAAHPNTGAVVLFFGLPPLSEKEARALKESGAKLIVVSSFRPGYRQLMERQVIHRVIAPRPEAPPPGSAPPRTARERFDQDYLLITPAEAARLP